MLNFRHLYVFVIGRLLWNLLQMKGYELQMMNYSEWYQKVKSVAEKNEKLTNLLYLLDSLVKYVSSMMSSFIINLCFLDLNMADVITVPLTATIILMAMISAFLLYNPLNTVLLISTVA